VANSSYAIVQAPSILGLRPSGVERLGERLLEYGLAKRLDARVDEHVEPLPYSAQRDPQTQTLNADAIAAWSPRLADAVARVLDRREFPIVLGGDCSILLGTTLALKRRGRYGLLFLDGHGDFYQPEVNPNGEAASMELAFATGYGPELLTNLEGHRPLMRPEDVVAFGYRDVDEQRQYGSQPLAGEILALDLATIRRLGIEQASNLALERLTHAALDGFFIHLDADCLDDVVMPAVDYRLPDGLSVSELEVVLSTAMATGRAVGLEVTIYNPSLDGDGAAGRALANVLGDALRPNALR
jgi:arginase